MSESLILQLHTETVDGLEVNVLPFGAYYALGLFARLAKSLGGALGALSGVAEDTDLSTIGPQLTSALSTLTPSEVQSLALEILKNTAVWLDMSDGKGVRKVEINSQAKFDAVFNGRFRTMFKILGLALKVNFASFSDGSESEPVAQSLPVS